MTKNIAFGFRNVLNFRGRATRPEFWWFALAVGVIFFFLNIGVSVYIFMQAVLIDMEARGGELTGSITPAQEAQVVQQIIEVMFKASAVPFIVVLLLLSSVTVRRLHDVGKSGILLFSFLVILVLHVCLLAYGGAIIVSQPELKFWAQSGLWMASAYEIFVLIIMSIALCRESEPFNNDFGPNPYPLDFEPLKRSLKNIDAPPRSYQLLDTYSSSNGD